MNVLHLFSNSKWTGPAEPALTLCAALRDAGVQTHFACSPGPDLDANKIVHEARARGIEPILDLHLNKHRHPIHNRLDTHRLRRLITAQNCDLLHTHLDNDHLIAANAKVPGIRLVRSSYYGVGFPDTRRSRRLLNASDFIIEPSRIAANHDKTAFNLPEHRTRVVPTPVDLTRFDPTRHLPDTRAQLGIPPDAFVVGIVARMQTHRHYEDLWDAAAQLIHEDDRIHVLVVGRGTKQDEVAYGPVRRRGLADRVHFTGFLDGDHYVAALNAFDAKVFLVPGSDGTCRAVREAMAMAKPVVAADRGMLSELVDHSATGFIVPTQPQHDAAQALACCLRNLATDPDLARQCGDAAREKAQRDFDPAVQAARIAEIYRALLST